MNLQEAVGAVLAPTTQPEFQNVDIIADYARMSVESRRDAWKDAFGALAISAFVLGGSMVAADTTNPAEAIYYMTVQFS